MVASSPDATQRILDALARGERRALARAISLVESVRLSDQALAASLLGALPASPSNTLRVGVTGVPGSGKSTLIEALGVRRVTAGQRVAVLTVDPSSERTGGSLLGDVTRMPKLAASPLSFVRTTPSRGVLGGAAGSTWEAIALCEAAGYSVVFVETVGVGQGEQVVSHLVDYVLLVAMAGAGDEIQGLKRGILECVDGVLVNKADAVEVASVQQAKHTFASALGLLRRQPIWVGTASALEGEGIDEAWRAVEQRINEDRQSGILQKHRETQRLAWFRRLVSGELQRAMMARPGFAKAYREAEQAVTTGDSPSVAARRVLTELEANVR